VKLGPAVPVPRARPVWAAGVPTVNDGHDRQLQQGLQGGLQGEQLGERGAGERRQQLCLHLALGGLEGVSCAVQPLPGLGLGAGRGSPHRERLQCRLLRVDAKPAGREQP